MSKELGLRVHDVSLEIAGVHMFTQKTDLHEALNLANRAVLLGPRPKSASGGPSCVAEFPTPRESSSHRILSRRLLLIPPDGR